MSLAPLAQLDRASVYGTEGCPFESGGVYCTRSCVGGEEVYVVTDGTVSACATCGGVLISLSPALFLFSFSGREVHHDWCILTDRSTSRHRLANRTERKQRAENLRTMQRAKNKWQAEYSTWCLVPCTKRSHRQNWWRRDHQVLLGDSHVPDGDSHFPKNPLKTSPKERKKQTKKEKLKFWKRILCLVLWHFFGTTGNFPILCQCTTFGRYAHTKAWNSPFSDKKKRKS